MTLDSGLNLWSKSGMKLGTGFGSAQAGAFSRAVKVDRLC